MFVANGPKWPKMAQNQSEVVDKLILGVGAANFWVGAVNFLLGATEFYKVRLILMFVANGPKWPKMTQNQSEVVDNLILVVGAASFWVGAVNFLLSATEFHKV